MRTEVEIENGFAYVADGEWLAAPGQPCAVKGRASVKGLRGFIVPDRGTVCSVTVVGGEDSKRTTARESGAEGETGGRGGRATEGSAWFADAERPFLTRLDALPDEDLNLVASKLLVAPAASRADARRYRPVPMSLKNSFAVTVFRSGWTVAATKSRVTRIALAEGETLTVAPSALVAWIGKDPTGFCPKLGLLDLLLPRSPRGFALNFHGPAVLWLEGVSSPVSTRLFPRR